MPFVRFRFLLPLCNAGVDVLLLIAAMHAVDAYRLTLRNPWPLWEQAYQPVDPFFLRNAYHAPPPEPIAAIYLGYVACHNPRWNRLRGALPEWPIRLAS